MGRRRAMGALMGVVRVPPGCSRSASSMRSASKAHAAKVAVVATCTVNRHLLLQLNNGQYSNRGEGTLALGTAPPHLPLALLSINPRSRSWLYQGLCGSQKKAYRLAVHLNGLGCASSYQDSCSTCLCASYSAITAC